MAIAHFSPDGDFIAYTSDESGRDEIYVQALDSGARWQLSASGGGDPHWSDDGKEIVYVDTARNVVSVSVDRQADGRPDWLQQRRKW